MSLFHHISIHFMFGRNVTVPWGVKILQLSLLNAKKTYAHTYHFISHILQPQIYSEISNDFILGITLIYT